MREFWVKNQIREKLELVEKDAKGILGYVEGPPTLNGIPHIGHARGRVMKDIRYRWKTMEGYYMPFWAGWDCQGLPVELEVEKLLGVETNANSSRITVKNGSLRNARKPSCATTRCGLKPMQTSAFLSIRKKPTGPTKTTILSVNGKS